MMSKKKYFPNNYDRIASCPAEWFEPLTFEDFMDWRVGGWKLPSSVNCIIREQNDKTGKVKEYVYQRQSAAVKKVDSILKKKESTFTLADHDTVHHLYLKPYDEPYDEGEEDYEGRSTYY